MMSDFTSPPCPFALEQATRRAARRAARRRADEWARLTAVFGDQAQAAARRAAANAPGACGPMQGMVPRTTADRLPPRRVAGPPWGLPTLVALGIGGICNWLY